MSFAFGFWASFMFVALVFTVIGLLLRSSGHAIVRGFGDLFLTIALIVSGLDLVVGAGYRMPPGDGMTWWLPVQLFGVFLVLVGIGMSFRPGRTSRS